MKTAIFPFDRDCLPILESADLLRGIEIKKVISLRGWGFSGTTIPTYGGKQYTVSCELDSAMDDCDCLWIVDSWNPCSFSEHILPAVLCAKRKHKEIICTRKLSAHEKSVLKDSLREDFIRFTEDFDPQMQSTIPGLGLLGVINAPVVAVAGVTENTGKFDAQANLYRQFCRNGYDVCWISSRKEAVLMGAHAIPSFMFHPSLSENEKVSALNKFVMMLEGKEYPSLLLLGIPGSISLYSRKYSNDFGFLAQEILQAITPDVFIVGSPYPIHIENYSFEKVAELIEHQTGIPVDFSIMSSYMINRQESELQRKLVFSTIDKESVDQRVRQFSCRNLFHVDSLIDENKFYSAVLSELLSGEFQIV